MKRKTRSLFDKNKMIDGTKLTSKQNPVDKMMGEAIDFASNLTGLGGLAKGAVKFSTKQIAKHIAKAKAKKASIKATKEAIKKAKIDAIKAKLARPKPKEPIIKEVTQPKPKPKKAFNELLHMQTKAKMGGRTTEYLKARKLKEVIPKADAKVTAVAKSKKVIRDAIKADIVAKAKAKIIKLKGKVSPKNPKAEPKKEVNTPMTAKEKAIMHDDVKHYIGGIDGGNAKQFNPNITSKNRAGEKLDDLEQRTQDNVGKWIKSKKNKGASEVHRVSQADKEALANLKEGEVITNKSHTFGSNKDNVDTYLSRKYELEGTNLGNVKYKIKTTHDTADVGHINDDKRGQSLLHKGGKFKVTKKEEIPSKDVEYADTYDGFTRMRSKPIPAHTLVHLEQLPKEIVSKMTPAEKKKVKEGILSVAAVTAAVKSREQEN